MKTNNALSMREYAITFSQELMPNRLLDDIEEFLSGLIDGASDASATSKTANELHREVQLNRGKVFYS